MDMTSSVSWCVDRLVLYPTYAKAWVRHPATEEDLRWHGFWQAHESLLATQREKLVVFRDAVSSVTYFQMLVLHFPTKPRWIGDEEFTVLLLFAAVSLGQVREIHPWDQWLVAKFLSGVDRRSSWCSARAKIRAIYRLKAIAPPSPSCCPRRSEYFFHPKEQT